MKQPFTFVNMRILLFSFLLLFLSKTYAQQSDMLVFKKKGRTVKTYIKGSAITFVNNQGNWYGGRIEDIRNDSLVFREVIVRQVPTQWGVTRLDTSSSLLYKIHYSEIAGLPRQKESFGFIKNGNLLMIGSAGFIVLNLVNSAYLHYAPFGKDNRNNLIVAAGVFGAGLLLKKLYSPVLHLGKKYSLQYVGLPGKQ